MTRLQVIGDPESAVAAAFELSYRSLSPDSQRLFRLLGLVPGPHTTFEAMSVLLGRATPQGAVALREVDELLAAHLVFEEQPGRFRSHDLLRLYARKRLEDEPEENRRAAQHRLLSWYMLSVDSAAAAACGLYLRNEREELDLTGSSPAFDGPLEASAWLDAEMPNLIAAVFHCAENGPAPFAWHLVDGLRGYLFTRRRDVDWITTARIGLRAADAHDSTIGRALCHLSLGHASGVLGDPQTGIEECLNAAAAFGSLGHQEGQASALNNAGDMYMRSGDLRAAVSLFEGCMELRRRPKGLAVTIQNLSYVARDQGRFRDAIHHGREALKLAQTTEEPGSLSGAAFALGAALLAAGQVEEAERHLFYAWEQAGIGGTEPEMFDSLGGLVLLCVRTGRVQQALEWVDDLLPMIDRDININSNTPAATAVIEAYSAAGMLAEALAIGKESLDRARAGGYRLVTMRLRLLLARIEHTLGNHEYGGPHLAEALAFAEDQALPERQEIAALLAEAGIV